VFDDVSDYTAANNDNHNPMRTFYCLYEASFATEKGTLIMVASSTVSMRFGIAGKYKAGGEKIDFFKDTKDEDGDILMEGAKKFDAGLGVGVAYEINKFFIDLTGEFGLTKIYDGDGAPKNINFSIGVGYKF
jgi:hypothetical protein